MDRMDNDKRAQTLRSMKADMFHQTADSLFYKHKKGNRRDDKTMKNAVQTEVTLMRTVSDSVTPTRFPLVSVPSVLVCWMKRASSALGKRDVCVTVGLIPPKRKP